MKATVAFVLVWCLLVSSRPAAAQEPIESRSIISEQVGLIAGSDRAPSSPRSYALAQMTTNGAGVSNWKTLIIGVAVLVAVVIVVRATSGNNSYQPPHQ